MDRIISLIGSKVQSKCRLLFRFWCFLKGYICLRILFQDQSTAAQTLCQTFKSHDISPESYSYQLMNSKNIVYIKCNLDSYHSYIGYSSADLPSRESSRWRKLVQYLKDKMTNAEPFVKLIARKKNFWRLPCIYLTCRDSKADAEAYESQLIAQLHPEYNASCESTIHHAKYNRSCGFIRLFKQTRCLTQNKQPALELNSEYRTQLYRTMQALCSKSSRSFTAFKSLLSSHTHIHTIYGLRRMLQHMPQPMRTRGIKQLRALFAKKGLVWPKNPKPLCIPFFVQDSFKKSASCFVKAWVRDSKANCLPLHIPKVNIVESGYPSIARLLHNFQKFEIDHPHQCQCQHIQEMFPAWPTVNGHSVVSGYEMKGIEGKFYDIVSSSSQTTVYLDPNIMHQKIYTAMSSWGKHHNVPRHLLEKRFKKWITPELEKHKHSSMNRFTTSSILALKKFFPGIIWHSADHEQANLILYCPVAYYECILNTFAKHPEIFRPVECNAQEMSAVLFNMLPPSLRSLKQKKFVHFLPTAFVLPKRKKGFASGRPVIRFHKTPYSRIFKAAGRLYQDVCNDIYENLPYGKSTVLKCFKALKNWSGSKRIYSWSNQDLSGFFTSIPQHKLLQSVHRNIEDYCKKHKTNTSHVFLVYIGKHKMGSLKTKSLNNCNWVRIRLRQVIDAIEFAMKYSFFMVHNKMYQQTRGCCIGNPLSPMICDGCIVNREIMNQTDRKTEIAIRYVDNLASFSTAWDHQGWDPNFYGFPIVLEECPDPNVFLGCRISQINGRLRIQYIVHPEKWRYTHPQGAGSKHRLMTGLHSRATLAVSCSFPHSEKMKAIALLEHQYVRLGFDSPTVHRILKHYCKIA